MFKRLMSLSLLVGMGLSNVGCKGKGQNGADLNALISSSGKRGLSLIPVRPFFVPNDVKGSSQPAKVAMDNALRLTFALVQCNGSDAGVKITKIEDQAFRDYESFRRIGQNLVDRSGKNIDEFSSCKIVDNGLLNGAIFLSIFDGAPKSADDYNLKQSLWLAVRGRNSHIDAFTRAFNIVVYEATGRKLGGTQLGVSSVMYVNDILYNPCLLPKDSKYPSYDKKQVYKCDEKTGNYIVNDNGDDEVLGRITLRLQETIARKMSELTAQVEQLPAADKARAVGYLEAMSTDLTAEKVKALGPKADGLEKKNPTKVSEGEGKRDAQGLTKVLMSFVGAGRSTFNMLPFPEFLPRTYSSISPFEYLSSGARSSGNTNKGFSLAQGGSPFPWPSEIDLSKINQKPLSSVYIPNEKFEIGKDADGNSVVVYGRLSDSNVIPQTFNKGTGEYKAYVNGSWQTVAKSEVKDASGNYSQTSMSTANGTKDAIYNTWTQRFEPVTVAGMDGTNFQKVLDSSKNGVGAPGGYFDKVMSGPNEGQVSKPGPDGVYRAWDNLGYAKNVGMEGGAIMGGKFYDEKTQTFDFKGFEAQYGLNKDSPTYAADYAAAVKQHNSYAEQAAAGKFVPQYSTPSTSAALGAGVLGAAGAGVGAPSVGASTGGVINTGVDTKPTNGVVETAAGTTVFSNGQVVNTTVNGSNQTFDANGAVSAVIGPSLAESTAQTLGSTFTGAASTIQTGATSAFQAAAGIFDASVGGVSPSAVPSAEAGMVAAMQAQQFQEQGQAFEDTLNQGGVAGLPQGGDGFEQQTAPIGTAGGGVERIPNVFSDSPGAESNNVDGGAPAD